MSLVMNSKRDTAVGILRADPPLLCLNNTNKSNCDNLSSTSHEVV